MPSPGGPTSRTWSSASPRRLRRLEGDRELLLDALLPDEVVQAARPQRALELVLLGCAARGHELRLAHAAFLERSPHPLLRLQVGIHLCERLLGLDDREAELDERVARDQLGRRARPGLDLGGRLGAELLAQLEHDSLSRLLADPGNRDEARDVLERDRAPQIGGRRAGHDRERHLRPDPGDRQQVLEELALGRLGEAVELERVLAHVRVDLDGDLLRALRAPQRALRRGHEVADAVHVEDERVAAQPCGPTRQASDHPTARSSGGASAWQIPTASASAAWWGSGSSFSPRIACTIR